MCIPTTAPPYHLLIKTDVPMGYNRQAKQMKKLLISLFLLSGVITFSSFVVSEWYTCKTCDGKGFWMTRDCPSCSGTGRKLNIVDCSQCNGNGYIRDTYGDKKTCPRCNGTKKESIYTTCPSCNGSGEEKIPCRTCNGKGKVWVND